MIAAAKIASASKVTSHDNNEILRAILPGRRIGKKGRLLMAAPSQG
jgi:hypothetical protein